MNWKDLHPAVSFTEVNKINQNQWKKNSVIMDPPQTNKLEKINEEKNETFDQWPLIVTIKIVIL